MIITSHTAIRILSLTSMEAHCGHAHRTLCREEGGDELGSSPIVNGEACVIYIIDVKLAIHIR